MNRTKIWILTLVPLAIAAWVWLSSLAFVPVPWPDDSAFYFGAKSLMSWPPRYVMLPEAPFEPTYAIFSFNIMPAFQILLGVGRWIGIDGSFALKFWSLLFWGLTGSAIAVALSKKKVPFTLTLVSILFLAFDPISRWGAVIVRPESIVGFTGTLLVLGLTFDFPEKWKERGFWHPVSALLALAAYFHYNSIHLVFPVIAAYLVRKTFFEALKGLTRIGALTILYLVPWIFIIVTHSHLFLKQMAMQWQRLSTPNDWLSSPTRAIDTLMQAMGSPEPWPANVQWAGAILWFIIFSSLFFGILLPLICRIEGKWGGISLAPAAAWVVSACWLWNSKPEVWFVYYIHVALGVFVAIALAKTWLENYRRVSVALSIALGCLVLLFAYIDLTQAFRLGETQTWHWSTYNSFVSCIDNELTALQKNRNIADDHFQVWGPTFPDVLIELSRRHPQWILTRTNDFWERAPLAVQHGRDVDAVVTTEMLNWPERTISSPMEEHPEISSIWMTWKEYFLNQLYIEKDWKSHRYLCQRGRWQAFIFMK